MSEAIPVEMYVDENGNISYMNPSLSDDLFKPILNRALDFLNFSQMGSNKKETTLFYPSVYNKKYKLHIIYNEKLIDDKTVSALRKYAEEYRRSGNLSMAGVMEDYIKRRSDLMKDHIGKYVILRSDGIFITEKEGIGKNELSFDNKQGGLYVKVGDEFNDNTSTLYMHIYSRPVEQYKIPIEAGNITDKPRLWVTLNNAVVDTGCTRTTFNMLLKDFILEKYPNYPLETSSTNVVGGQIVCLTGFLNVELCGVDMYIKVSFANLPPDVDVLIGTDILSRGKLDCDSGRFLSFTQHQSCF